MKRGMIRSLRFISIGIDKKSLGDQPAERKEKKRKEEEHD